MRIIQIIPAPEGLTAVFRKRVMPLGLHDGADVIASAICLAIVEDIGTSRVVPMFLPHNGEAALVLAAESAEPDETFIGYEFESDEVE